MTPDTQCSTCTHLTTKNQRPWCSVFGVIPREYLWNDEPCPKRVPIEESDERPADTRKAD